MTRSRLFGLFLSLLIMTVSAGQAGWPYASTVDQSNYIHEDTKVKELDSFFFQSPFMPGNGDDFKLTTIVQRFPFDPLKLGEKKAKGAAQNDYSCVSAQVAGIRNLGRAKDKFDAFGNAATTKKASGNNNCDFLRAQTTFKGSQRQSEGSSVRVINGVQRLPRGADNDCYAPGTLCLQDGRFKAQVTWRDFEGSGMAYPMSTGFDSGTFYFFNGDNTDLLVQLLRRCSFNDHFWVFASAATNVEYELTVTDTVSGSSRSYRNPLGTTFEPILDTAAFATCP